MATFEKATGMSKENIHRQASDRELGIAPASEPYKCASCGKKVDSAPVAARGAGKCGPCYREEFFKSETEKQAIERLNSEAEERVRKRLATGYARGNAAVKKSDEKGNVDPKEIHSPGKVVSIPGDTLGPLERTQRGELKPGTIRKAIGFVKGIVDEATPGDLVFRRNKPPRPVTDRELARENPEWARGQKQTKREESQAMKTGTLKADDTPEARAKILGQRAAQAAGVRAQRQMADEDIGEVAQKAIEDKKFSGTGPGHPNRMSGFRPQFGPREPPRFIDVETKPPKQPKVSPASQMPKCEKASDSKTSPLHSEIAARAFGHRGKKMPVHDKLPYMGPDMGPGHKRSMWQVSPGTVKKATVCAAKAMSMPKHGESMKHQSFKDRKAEVDADERSEIETSERKG